MRGSGHIRCRAGRSAARRPCPGRRAARRPCPGRVRNGLMLYSRQTSGGYYGEWFAPPLTITDDEIADLLRRTEAAVAGLHAELIAEHIL